MLAIVAGVLAAIALAAWLVALVSAVSLWRGLPTGHRLKNLLSPAWLQFDSIRDIAGPEADRYTRPYVWALVVFFVVIAAFMALSVVVIVTSQNSGGL
jgi:hypothetical protein